jgi:NADH dehydrogenase FAD-containing subunit
LKTCDDARRLRNAVGEAFEYASRPEVKDDPKLSDAERAWRRKERRSRLTFAIIGGGPTGVELSGELSDFIKDITKPRIGAYPDLRKDTRVVLVHGGKDLVPQFDEDLRKHALTSMQESGVDVRLNTKVFEVGDGFVKLASKEGSTQEEYLKTGLTVWAAGTEAVPFTKKLLDKLPETARGHGGKINVDPWLRCPVPRDVALGSVMVMGDAASFPDRRDNTFLPQTAQVAGQQGAYAARMLDRAYDLTVTPPQLDEEANNAMTTWLKFRGLEKAHGFDFLNLGLLAYVGGGQALTQVQIGDVPLSSSAGSISFVLWRSVYLVKQVATRNRVLVTFDWMKSAIFGRDITRL